MYAYTCYGFFTVSWQMLEKARGYRESPMLGLMPWRIGEDYAKPFTVESFIIMTSVVFTVLAAFAVFTLCTRKHGKELISGLCCCLFLYTTVFAGAVYLPARAEENLAKTEPARLVSELLYNESASPVIVAYNIGTRNAGLIQFLNLNTRVAIIRKAKNLPDNCIIIADERSSSRWSRSATTTSARKAGFPSTQRARPPRLYEIQAFRGHNRAGGRRRNDTISGAFRPLRRQ